MTFYNAPWALDGATISSALARRAQYAAMSGGEGIINALDLKVTQLATPGNGLLIAAGNAAITNRYQSDPNETYTVANPGTHTILSTEMPTSQPSAKSYLVLITVGDPEFSQVGHPWMTSDVLDPEVAKDYVYVRPWLLEVAAGTTSFEDLGLSYPAVALARIDVPANTTTITNAMITDVRQMARPRSKEVIFQQTGLTGDTRPMANNVWAPWATSWSLKIPKWATSANVMGYVGSMSVEGSKGAVGLMRAAITNAGTTPTTVYDENNWQAAGNDERITVQIAGEISIPSAARGTTQTFRPEVNPVYDTPNDSLVADVNSSAAFRILFQEAPA